MASRNLRLALLLVTCTGCPSFHRRGGVIDQAMEKDRKEFLEEDEDEELPRCEPGKFLHTVCDPSKTPSCTTRCKDLPK
jgi:hypothetical protein